jgi:hypothetical protein
VNPRPDDLVVVGSLAVAIDSGGGLTLCMDQSSAIPMTVVMFGRDVDSTSQAARNLAVPAAVATCSDDEKFPSALSSPLPHP